MEVYGVTEEGHTFFFGNLISLERESKLFSESWRVGENFTLECDFNPNMSSKYECIPKESVSEVPVKTTEVMKALQTPFSRIGYEYADKNEPIDECDGDNMRIKETHELTVDEFKTFKTEDEITQCEIKLDEEMVEYYNENYGIILEDKTILSQTIEFKEKALLIDEFNSIQTIPYSAIDKVIVTTMR